MSQSPVGGGKAPPRLPRKPEALPLGGTWTGSTAWEREGRRMREAARERRRRCMVVVGCVGVMDGCNGS